MPENPLIKRYLEAGMAFTQMTQARAEAIVKDLVKAGEVQTSRTEDLVAQIVERSRKNTERLLDQVRAEVRAQIGALGLATRDDLARLEKRLAAAERAAGPKVTKAVSSKGTAKRATTKSGTKKAAARRASGSASS